MIQHLVSLWYERGNWDFVIIVILAISLCPYSLESQSKRPVREIREAAKPGAAHALLEPFAGSWKIRAKYRLKPGSPPEMAVGKAEIRWILGQRFLEQSLEGKGLAGAFEGRGLIGYDNVLRRYTATWASSLNSGLTQMNGQFDAAARRFNFSAEATDPIQKREVRFSVVFQIISQDEWEYFLVAPDPESGNPVNLVEINYRRK